MDDEPKMENSPPIHLLPNELLVKIIDKLPRTQWTALELVDHKFQDAVLLAWESVREVDIERDFNYLPKATVYENYHDFRVNVDVERVRRQIAQNTESILKMLAERSPSITSLCDLPLIKRDPTLTGVQYLSEFKHLETVKFKKSFSSGIVNGKEVHFRYDIPLSNVAEFLETTRSRAALKEIIIDECSFYDPNTAARLRAAFDNIPNDPTRQLLQLESFSMRISSAHPLTFVDNIDASRMTKLSFGYSYIDSAVLTNLINRALQLQRIDFAFRWSCNSHINAPVCQGGRLQTNKNLLAALESRRSLTSLEFNTIWARNENVHGCTCHQFETEFKKMLRTIGPKLLNFVFNPGFLPPNINMGEIRDIIQRYMPRLKSIALGDVCAEDPEELRGIADGKILEEIELDPCYHNAEYKSIFNEVLSTIISKSPRLQRFIGVSYCPDQPVAAELCELSNLIDLRIEAYHLTKICFFAFIVFAEKLQVLHLGRIGQGVESGLIKLIEKATQLRELDLEGNVTNRLLECVAMSCPNLEKFWTRSDRITFDGVQMLVDRCPKLRWLYAQNTNRSLALKNLKLERYRKLEMELSKFF